MGPSLAATPVTELQPGTSDAPSVRLVRPIGHGGMGRVWLAEHLTLDTNVVVKFMSSDIAATADGAARFAREASVAAAVKSPHVVQVFDHGITPEGDAYIVMELLEGRDLAAYLSQSGPMAPRDVAALVAQVAKALGKAHQVGVIHRDIKPDNIFLCDADGGELFVKLLDFGVAKRDHHRITTAATTTGAVVGTPYYMSPEQIIGDKEIDARTDIWSLGVVAFEAMTGVRPFGGTTVGAITLAIHTASPSISHHLPTAPAALDDWFARVCARDPKGRYQTAREASQGLLEALGDAVPSSPLLRAPMASIVADGEGSDPGFARAPSSKWGAAGDGPGSDGRAATNLSSVFPVPGKKRKAPVAVVAAVLLVAGVIVVVAVLRRAGSKEAAATSTPSSATSISSATSGNAQTGNARAGSEVPPPDPPASGAAAAASASAEPTPALMVSAARGAVVVPSRGAGSAAPTRPSGKPTGAPGHTTKPGRTRDDDDIK